ncbi:MAG: hypothetical protein D6776_00300 [Planctomycetota bacterium]|nr:MAG: hypothetical protein D6776_00300 [Planctomycetota bacterium]
MVRRPDGSFSSPNGALAREAVERVLRALARLEAAEILPPPDEPADRGLDRPWRRIEAQLGADEPARAETIVLTLGVADPHGRYYARLERRTPAGVETIWCTLDRRVVDALDAVLLAPPPGARRTGVVLEGPSATAAPRTPTRSPRPEAPRRP